MRLYIMLMAREARKSFAKNPSGSAACAVSCVFGRFSLLAHIPDADDASEPFAPCSSIRLGPEE
jgi:hypothetical protein